MQQRPSSPMKSHFQQPPSLDAVQGSDIHNGWLVEYWQGEGHLWWQLGYAFENSGIPGLAIRKEQIW
jgi:hypothetical protein